MNDQNYIEFEAYLSKEMAKEHVVTFETRLKNEPEFNQAFITYKGLSSFLEHKFENETASNVFQENLKKISNKHFSNQKNVEKNTIKPKTFNLFKYAIAASVALLIGVFTFNQFSNPTYGDYASYDAISLTVRGANDALLQTAENAFNNKEFAKAEHAFKSLIELDSENSELILYSAISNIELNNFEIADGLLEDLKEGKSAYKYKGAWYLALSKLKQKDEKACLEILKTIPEDADDYKQAQKLIKKLD
ncbi:tetratricopeptide repeat protein [Thalassobellus citreus]|uniref:tetratricopeptide repeat protein n=1 Tax=Thalassobellus citreus TaxID=3367752 RepID=UPI0037A2BD5C